ncbi:hypothetical protein BDV06DRAFT_197806 [Aspergillus oleicola]
MDIKIPCTPSRCVFLFPRQPPFTHPHIHSTRTKFFIPSYIYHSFPSTMHFHSIISIIVLGLSALVIAMPPTNGMFHVSCPSHRLHIYQGTCHMLRTLTVASEQRDTENVDVDFEKVGDAY